MIEFLPLFPSPVIKIDTKPEFNDIRGDLINFCYSERENSPIGIDRSNNGGWHSELLLEEERFHKYKKFIEKYIEKSFESFVNSGVKIIPNSYWININGINSVNTEHNHPGSDISGCFWIKSSEYSGTFRFTNPNDFIHYSLLKTFNFESKSQYYFSERYFFKPIEGEMILFPSNMNHCVFENKDDNDRISIAFNLKIYEK
jgi:uncharacterized protein (TIGR02466 family)